MEPNDVEEDMDDQRWYHGPIKYILALFLILLMILWIVPHYGVKLDPHPRYTPSIDEVVLSDLSYTDQELGTDPRSYVTPSLPAIKQTATKIATLSCEGDRICYAKAIYYFVRDNIQYVSDPVGKEYFEPPTEVLSSQGADCESGSFLLASLLESVGINTELVFIIGHAYVRIYLPEALDRYKLEDDWVYLDWTCSSCDFGEIPWENIRKQSRTLEVP